MILESRSAGLPSSTASASGHTVDVATLYWYSIWGHWSCSVATFKTSCTAALRKLTEQCHNVTPASDDDMQWLRLPTLAEELAVTETNIVTPGTFRIVMLQY